MAREMHRQFQLNDESSDATIPAAPLASQIPQHIYTWNPKIDHGRCFPHKMSLVVKGGLAELGRVGPTRALIREATLGVFPVSSVLADIPEEDEDEGGIDEVVVIDGAKEGTIDELPADEDGETDHDSEEQDTITAAPEYDEEAEDEADKNDLDAPSGDPDPDNEGDSDSMKTAGSRRKANTLNSLLKQVRQHLYCV